MIEVYRTTSSATNKNNNVYLLWAGFQLKLLFEDNSSVLEIPRNTFKNGNKDLLFNLKHNKLERNISFRVVDIAVSAVVYIHIIPALYQWTYWSTVKRQSTIHTEATLTLTYRSCRIFQVLSFCGFIIDAGSSRYSGDYERDL